MIYVLFGGKILRNRRKRLLILSGRYNGLTVNCKVIDSGMYKTGLANLCTPPPRSLHNIMFESLQLTVNFM